MTVSNHHIQNVIQAYGRQLNRSCSRNRVCQGGQPEQPDRITISSEAMKKQIISTTASEAVERITCTQNRDDLEHAILGRLSRAYGQRLDVGSDEEAKGIVFKVVGESDGEEVKYIDSKDSECLAKRLFEITELSVSETTG